jgi:membrane peptidoglycan carboxypeptidase
LSPGRLLSVGTRLANLRATDKKSSTLIGSTGTGARLRRWNAYGKTGTTTANADAWFIGWSEGRVLGTWMGKRRDVAGEVISGKGAPAEFFRRVSNSANDGLSNKPPRAGRQEPDDRRISSRPAPSSVAARPPERKRSSRNSRNKVVTAPISLHEVVISL